jgi:hypothetical protein
MRISPNPADTTQNASRDNVLEPALKEIAWNRVRLKIPSSWEIARLDTHQIIFQDNALPTLELKWQRIKGKFSHRTHLKRLAALHKKALNQPVENWPLPSAWQKALTGYTTAGFSWQADSGSGRGVILYCPVCRMATLIQFFLKPFQKINHVPPLVLKTFKDHRDDGMTDWSVFDIRATLPDAFVLQSHQFKPGNFLLEFSDKHQEVQLLRWAPASILLRHQTLAQFAEGWTHGSQKRFVGMEINGCPGIEYQTVITGRLKRCAARLTAKPAFQVWRIWHLTHQNRILGVKIAGKDCINAQLVNALCKAYESL